MKYVKMLGLLAVAAAALMAFAGTASATTLTGEGGVALVKGDQIIATSTHTQLTGSVTITCKHSLVEGKISNAGGAGVNVSGNVDKLTFTECGANTVEVKKAGSLSIEGLGGNKGTLTSTGAEVTVLTHNILGTVHCIYVTNNTHIGTVTGGSPASLAIASAPIKQSATDGFCGSNAEWDGSYSVTSPSTLDVD